MDNIEYKIFECLFLDNILIEKFNLDEKFFKGKKILNSIKKIYQEYGYLDPKLFISNYENKEKSTNFVKLCLEQEVDTKNLYGYYKLLKNEYNKNKVNELTQKLNENEITFTEYMSKIEELSLGDYESSGLLKASEVKINMDIKREYTYIDELDYLTKGIEYGKMNIFSGVTNHGKTTLMTQFAKECLTRNKKIFYFSGEQTSSEFKNYLYVGMCQKIELEFIADKNNSRIYDIKPNDKKIQELDNKYKDSLYIYDNKSTDNSINFMLSCMKKCLNKGVRIFFIDNFMQLDNSEQLDQQTKIVENLTRFARNNNAIVNLVAHPRKISFGKNRLSIFDIAGTQNIANKACNICSIIRTDCLPQTEKEEIGKVLLGNYYNINKCDAIIEVIKTKGNACKMVGLNYNKDLKKYNEATKISDNERTILMEEMKPKVNRRVV